MRSDRILAGKYRFVRQLGEGGEGSVFLAIHLQTEMFWAIKEIPEKNASTGEENSAEKDALTGEANSAGMSPLTGAGKDTGKSGSLCHELQMMKSLKNKHLPEIIDVIREDGSIFLVMEHVRGCPMNRRLRDGRTVSPKEIEDIALQVTEALCYLESRQPPVCHLDIKPSNLIRRPDGLIKLVDFGSAWAGKEKPRGMGTDGYAAPEQYAGSGAVPDARSDIYSLGATLYRMISGKKYSKALHGSCVPNCPEALSKIILTCLEEDPADRFQSAVLLRKALEKMKKKARMRNLRIQMLGALAIALPAAAFCLQVIPAAFDISGEEGWDYATLLREALTVSEEKSRDLYRKAVFLRPQRKDAYLQYLEDVQRDGAFSEEEELFLRDLLHTIPLGSEMTYEEVLAEDPESYGEISLGIGLAYWYSSRQEDAQRIAEGWFDKAAGTARESSLPEDGWVRTAVLYQEISRVRQQAESVSPEDRPARAALYWKDLGELLERIREGELPGGGLMQLKLFRNALSTLAFLGADLDLAGIGKEEQMERIGDITAMVKDAESSLEKTAAAGGLFGEIAQAQEAAVRAVEDLPASTEDL